MGWVGGWEKGRTSRGGGIEGEFPGGRGHEIDEHGPLFDGFPEGGWGGLRGFGDDSQGLYTDHSLHHFGVGAG